MTEGETRRLLIVEDNSFLGRVMELSFTKYGYICKSAGSPAEAFEILKEYTPDIILSDYEMPLMNGFEFRLKLLENPAWKDIPFIFLTSHSDEQLVLKGLNLHALDYIIKGTPYPVIASKLDNILNSLRHEHKRSIAELRQAAEMLQVNSIPKHIPEIAGFSVNFWNRSFQNYPGGDFMDLIKVDDRYTFLFAGDIMGKKWQAWFFTFGYLSYIRSAIRFCILDKNLDCLEIMKKVNQVVCLDESLRDILSSLSLLKLDSETGVVTYCGAGDLPLIHYKASGGTTSRVSASGLLLGLKEEGDFDQQQIVLEAGDKLLAFTDGLIDMVVDGEKKSSFDMFAEQMRPLLNKNGSFHKIDAYLSEQLSNEVQVDDASLIYIERKTT